MIASLNLIEPSFCSGGSEEIASGSASDTWVAWTDKQALRRGERASRLGAVSEQIIFVDTSEVREGKLDELRLGVRDLAGFVEARETDPISYEIYFSADGRLMTVVQVHPDSASMERHMEIAGPVFARFAGLVDLRTVDIYGSPSQRVVEQLQQKADMLGTATVTVHDRQAGFARLGPR